MVPETVSLGLSPMDLHIGSMVIHVIRPRGIRSEGLGQGQGQSDEIMYVAHGPFLQSMLLLVRIGKTESNHITSISIFLSWVK